MENKKPHPSELEAFNPEGAILEWTTPRRRPVVRAIASVTCFTFILTQSPVIPSAFARPPQFLQPENLTNASNYISNYTNAATLQNSMENLREYLTHQQRIQQALEINSLTAKAGMVQGLEVLTSEILQGGQAIQQTSSTGTSAIHN
ncbi:MAG: hypothetical protein HYZ90_04400, partial [Candidatus Omnitrophica bacterium]|nr:hypothetical protein [Candidatus Omnitrophota bacterium]